MDNIIDIEDLNNCLNCGCDDLERIKIIKEDSREVKGQIFYFQISKYKCKYCDAFYNVEEDLDD